MSVVFEAARTARPSHTWRLIDIIYETGQNPSNWPALLEAMVNAIATAEHTEPTEPALHRHLAQALELNRHLSEQFDIHHTVEPLLASISFPLLLINENLEVLYRGDHFSDVLHGASDISVVDKTLEVTDPEHAAALHEIFSGVADSVELLTDQSRESDPHFRVHAFSLPVAGMPSLCALAWFDTLQRTVQGSTDLADLFDLTQAETDLLQGIIVGQSYRDLADRRGVSEHTVKSQIKQIFAKTESHSRAELVQKVLCGPRLLNRLIKSPGERFHRVAPDASRRNQIVALDDDACLSYSEYGPPEGHAILLLHNVLGSRRQIPVPEDHFYDQGVRLIVPDRPGFGLSSVMATFTQARWCQLIAGLLDHLQLETALMIGNSMGGYYAMAAAIGLPDRFQRLGLVSTMPELRTLEELEDMDSDMRQVITLGRRAPRLARQILPLLIRDTPERYLDRRINKLPQADQALYRDPAFYEMSVDALRECLRHGSRAMVRDLLLLCSPWPFDVTSIQPPVQLWHGDRDIAAPVASVKRLAARIPNCRSIFVPEETHMLIHRHWHSIIAGLLAPAALPG